MNFKKIGFSVLFSFLSGCATEGVFRRELPGSASDVRKAIVSVIGDPKNTSFNGRELTSRYYAKNGAVEDPVKGIKERCFTRVTVLGDRRPFDIQIEVIVEKKLSDGNFEAYTTDDALANEIGEKIKKALHQSLDKRNILDDFRAF